MRRSGWEGLGRLLAVFVGFVGFGLAMWCCPVVVFDLDRGFGEAFAVGLSDGEGPVGCEVEGPAAFVDQMVVPGTDR
jgi:hypothetical protein